MTFKSPRVVNAPEAVTALTAEVEILNDGPVDARPKRLFPVSSTANQFRFRMEDSLEITVYSLESHLFTDDLAPPLPTVMAVRALMIRPSLCRLARLVPASLIGVVTVASVVENDTKNVRAPSLIPALRRGPTSASRDCFANRILEFRSDRTFRGCTPAYVQFSTVTSGSYRPFRAFPSAPRVQRLDQCPRTRPMLRFLANGQALTGDQNVNILKRGLDMLDPTQTLSRTTNVCGLALKPHAVSLLLMTMPMSLCLEYQSVVCGAIGPTAGGPLTALQPLQMTS
ncbi:hypothetical protein BV898_02017 [Hypsibius exemplaris]|uniref:Uncharacterized protein n=1 Tax=Hypsibius exemplaris TaxID=2072580 RepID=A0A1W0X997_HYPEX|nr:hypothetical protein BV898_02017 [Hypsibius exemplaris]